MEVFMDKQAELVERLSSQIVEWEAEIARLEDEAETAPEEGRKPYRDSIEKLQQKRKEAQATLQHIGTDDVNTLGDLEKGAEGVAEDVKHDLRKAILKVK